VGEAKGELITKNQKPKMIPALGFAMKYQVCGFIDPIDC
jgi:hypothetical protein